MAVVVSAPGKLILMGEHAVVYGRPALIAAVDLRLRVRLSPGSTPGVLFDLPDLAIRTEISWKDLLAHTRETRAAWEAVWQDARDPRTEGFRALGAGSHLHLLQIALGETAENLTEELGEDSSPPLDLRLDSELPIGCGLGSSAATAVAVAAGYLSFRGAEPTLERIEKLAHEIERRQHGTPSGVDAATVLRGGALWARRLPSGAMDVAPVPLASPLLRHWRICDTGTPAESTGAVVAAVRERYRADPAGIERWLGQIGEATSLLREELGAPREDARRVVELMRAGQEALEALGVVPAPVRELVRQVENEGGAAKISGAGSLRGPGAGVLMVYHADPERPATWPFLAALPSYAVELGAPGLRIETAP
jgi:mevalonate kinase